MIHEKKKKYYERCTSLHSYNQLLYCTSFINVILYSNFLYVIL